MISASGIFGRTRRDTRRGARTSLMARRLAVEPLEERALLSVWEFGPSFPSGARSSAAAINDNGSLFALGGTPYVNGEEAGVDYLSPGAAGWTAGQTLNSGRLDDVGAGIDALGRPIVFGGTKQGKPTTVGFVYDIKDGTGGEIAKKTFAVNDFAYAADAGSRLYSIGGLDAGNSTVTSVERFDGLADTWTPLASLPAARSRAAGVYDGRGHVLVIGGLDATGARQSTVFSYDVAAGSWSQWGDAPEAVSDGAAAVGMDGLVYLMGGDTATGASDRVHVLDPGAGTWSAGPDMQSAHSDLAAVVSNDGYVYALGGGTNVVERLNTSAVNKPPVAVDDNVTGTEGQPLVIDVLANDSDADGDPLTALLVAGPANGSAVVNPDGSITYTPSANFNGIDSFTYKANDGAADSNVATVAITVNSVNDAPTATLAVSDITSYAVTKNRLTYDIGAQILYDFTDNGVTTPNTPVWGMPSFASGSQGTIDLVVDSAGNVNGSTPRAQPWNWGTLRGEILQNFWYYSFNLTGGTWAAPLGNTAQFTGGTVQLDNTFLGDFANLSIVSGFIQDGNSGNFFNLSNGVGLDGKFEFTATGPDGMSFNFVAKGYNGAGTGTYMFALDTAGPSFDNGSVTADVNAMAVVPVYVSIDPATRSFSIPDKQLTNALHRHYWWSGGKGIDRFAGAVDPAGNFAGDAHFHGLVVFKSMAGNAVGGTFTDGNSTGFDPTNRLQLGDTFSTVFTDASGLFDLAVTGSLIAQTRVHEFTVTYTDDSAINVSTLDGNDVRVTGPNGFNALATFVSVDNNTNGPSRVATYRIIGPDGDWDGFDNGNYAISMEAAQVSDLDGSSVAPATLGTFQVALPEPPTAVDDSAATDEDTPVVIDVLANDSDPGGAPLTAFTVTGPANGAATLNADGTFTYTPGANFNGADSFTYRAGRVDADSNLATVTITVNSVNDAPVAVDDSYSVAKNSPLVRIAMSGVLPNDSDVEGDPLTAVLVNGPANGTVVLGADGSFTYSPDTSFSGVDSFTYVANDGSVDSNVATASITVVNTPPVAAADAYLMDRDTVLTIPASPNGLLANDTDVDGDPLTARLAVGGGPANGSLVLGVDGSYTYTPAAGFVGLDTFQYIANDGTNDSNVATVAINVLPVNHVPVAVDDAYAVNANTPLIVPTSSGVLVNDTDADPNDTLSAVLVAGPINGTLALLGDGSFTYTPNLGLIGTDTFTYKANDGLADSNIATVSITVSAVNNPPVATNDTAITNEDTPVNVNVLANDTDAQGDPLSIRILTNTNGTAVVNNGGTPADPTDDAVDFAPAANFNGAASFTYVVNDGLADSNVATVAVTVNPVNDPPALDLDANDSSGQTGADFAAGFTAGSVAVAIADADATISDIDSANLQSLTATLTNPLDGAAETLAANTTGTAITASYNSATGALTLSGTDTVANYQQVLRTLTYNNTTLHPATTARTITFVTNDGTGLSNTATTTVTVGIPLRLLDSFAGPAFTGYRPPDSTVAAGPQQIVAMVNTQIAIYDKTTGSELFRQNLNGPTGFFGGVGATSTVFDPWVLFDADTQRFFALGVDLASASQSNMFVAVSTNATPASGADWHKYKLDFTHNATGTGLGTGFHFPDYPKMGVDQDAIWISGNYFPIQFGTGVYAGITAIEKAPLLTGGPANIVYEEHFQGFSVFPLTQYGPAPAQYFAETFYNGGSSVTIHAVTNVLTTPTRTTSTIAVPAFAFPNDVPQLGGGAPADAIDNRIMSGVWRNGSAWFAHPVEDPAIGDGEVVARWYQVDTNNFPVAAPTLVQSGNVDPGPGVHAWMPAVAVNGQGDMGIGFSLGGPNQYFGAGFTARLATDPLGETMLPVTTLVDGLESYVGMGGRGRNRWGDYSGISIDPVDDSSFWVMNEYASIGNTWATQIGSFAYVVGSAPVALDDTAVTIEDTPVSIDVLANDTDAEGDPLSIRIVSSPSGTAVVNDAGTPADPTDDTVDFTPNANFNGTAGFTYRVNDGQSSSNLATVTVTVAPVNDTPLAVDDAAITNEDTAVNVNVLANDTDVDGDPLSISILTSTNGTAVVNNGGTPGNPTDDTVDFTPNAQFSGTAGFTYLVNDGTVDSNVATAFITVNPVIGTKFFVVDAESKNTFQYDAAGNLVTNSALASANQTPWGAAASPDGSTLWVAEKERWIFVYDNAGNLLGSWTPQGEPKFDGIASDGTDIWTVNAETDRVDRFAGAAARRSGTASPSYSFALSGQNITPTGLTTDGTHLWVVNDGAAQDQVFKYTVAGALVGSWTIDAANANPTGITIDPTGASRNVWIVNSANATGKVFQYSAAATRTSGAQAADLLFTLAAANANPQGIADPPPPISNTLQHPLGIVDNGTANVIRSTAEVTGSRDDALAFIFANFRRDESTDEGDRAEEPLRDDPRMQEHEAARSRIESVVRVDVPPSTARTRLVDRLLTAESQSDAAEEDMFGDENLGALDEQFHLKL